MRQPKFRGYSLNTGKWHYGHGWYKEEFTEEYKEEKGLEGVAILYTDSGAVECVASSMGEFTGLNDTDGKELYEKDVIKIPSINEEIHGEYSYQEIIYRNGAWVVQYIKSEKGQVLPKGYTAGMLIDFYEYDRKKLVFEDNCMKYTDIEKVGNTYEKNGF